MSKILVVGPAWVGDMVMAQCLFKLIKARQPDAIIDVLAPEWSVPLLARMPEVASAIVMPVGHQQLKLATRYKMAKAFRAVRYQQAIVLPNSFKSALIPFWAKIPKRTGWLGEMRYFILNDQRTLDKKRYALMIERFMALGLEPNAPLPTNYPLPELIVAKESLEKAIMSHQIKYDGRPILALCPGAEFGSAKRWPVEHFAKLANKKWEEGWQIWLFGSAKDKVIANEIMQLTQQRCLDLTGKTKLDEAIDLLALANVVVSNDSGLMHIAAALKKPLVAVYGATSATFTPPLHDKAAIVTLQLACQPCFQRECPLQHHRCMQELTPEKVMAAIDNFVPQLSPTTCTS